MEDAHTLSAVEPVPPDGAGAMHALLAELTSPSALDRARKLSDELGKPLDAVCTRFTPTMPTIVRSANDAQHSLSETFCYDSMNRLTSVGGSSGCPGGTPANSFAYDLLGNMTSKADVGTYTFPASGAARPHAVSQIALAAGAGGGNTAFAYDADGQLLTETGTIARNLSWTPFNRVHCIGYSGSTCTPLSGNVLIYQYDADGNRVMQTGPVTGVQIYLPDGYVSFHAGDDPSIWLWSSTFVADGQVVAQTAGKTGALSHKYLHDDEQGSVLTVTDDSFNPASPVTRQDSGYDAYGQPRLANGAPDPNWGSTAPTRYGYINQEQLSAPKLMNLNARLYDPQIGLMLSPDPIVGDVADSQAWNAYSYARNNPTSSEDPTGLKVEDNHINITVNGQRPYHDYSYSPPDHGSFGGGGHGRGSDGGGSGRGGRGSDFIPIGSHIPDPPKVHKDGTITLAGNTIGQVIQASRGRLQVNLSNGTSFQVAQAFEEEADPILNSNEPVFGEEALPGESILPATSYESTPDADTAATDPINQAEDAEFLAEVAKLEEAAPLAAEGAEGASSFFEGTQYTSKVLQQMEGGVGEFHSFPESVTAFEDSGSVSAITGGDGAQYQMLRIPGSYQSTGGTWYDGEFQFIKDGDGLINHRLFVPTTPIGP